MDDNLTTNLLDEKHKTLKIASVNQAIAKIMAYMNEL